MPSRTGTPPRYSDVPLPRRRYVPGRGPHPRHGAEPHLPALPPPTAPLDAGAWQDSTAYRYAIDLFNHEYFWEAHEVLEGLWRETPRTSPTARFLKSLIQLSAACLREAPSRHAGARRLLARARAELDTLTGAICGVDVKTLARRMQELSSDDRTRVLAFHLELRDTAPASEASRTRH